jgi:hypothetical protein
LSGRRGKNRTSLDEERSGGRRYVRDRHHDDGIRGRGRKEGQKPAGGLEIVGLGAGERGPEAKADRSAAVVGMGVDQSAAAGGAVDRAMVLFEIEMEHADGEKYDESEDRALFHV